jgi:hypothetical protein
MAVPPAGGPGPAAPAAPAGPDKPEDPPAQAASRTVAATKETRETAKWLITTLTAATVTIFGAGPLLVRPTLDWVDDDQRTQLIVALISGALGIVANVALIVLIARVLQPARLTLPTLDRTFVRAINAERSRYLPAGARRGVADLLPRHQNYRLAVPQLKTQLTTVTREIADAQPTADKELLARQRFIQDQLATAEANLATYDDAITRVLDEAEFHHVHGLLGGPKQRWLIGALGTAAALGILTFSIALSTPPEDEDEAAEAAGDVVAAGSIAYLPAPVGGAQESLWRQLELAAAAAEDGTVPVLVNSGAGTADDPYVVTTICFDRGDCRATTFNVQADVLPVIAYEPDEVTVTYDNTRVSQDDE